MNANRSTLMDVLYPRGYPGNSLRARVTRTVLQPEIDRFEQSGVVAAAGPRSESSAARAAAPRSADAGKAA